MSRDRGTCWQEPREASYQVSVPWHAGPHDLVPAFQELMLVPDPPTFFTPFTCSAVLAAVAV